MKKKIMGTIVLSVFMLLGGLAVPGNSHATPSTLGVPLIATGGNITASFVGSSASFSSDLFLIDPFTGGDIFVFNNLAGGAPVDLSLASLNISGNGFGSGLLAGDALLFRLDVTDAGGTLTSFFSGLPSENAGTDGLSHTSVDVNMAISGQTLVGFEDVAGGGALEDFNDIEYSFTNVNNVPEPGLLVLLGSGLVGLFGANFFRKKQEG